MNQTQALGHPAGAGLSCSGGHFLEVGCSDLAQCIADDLAVGDIGGVVDLFQLAAQAALFGGVHILGLEMVLLAAIALGQDG